jgi:hypothetical protein
MHVHTTLNLNKTRTDRPQRVYKPLIIANTILNTGLSSQGTMINRDLLTTPAYDSVEIDRETTVAVPSIHNPVYNDKVIRAHYEMQDLDQEETAGDSDELKELRDECDINIPTDPITGYSTLLRPDKSQPTSSQVAFYESIKLNEGFLQGDDKDTANMNDQYSRLKQDSQTPLANSHTTSQCKVEKSSLESASEPVPKGILRTLSTAQTTLHTIPTDPETGYSSMIRPDKVVPPPGQVPLYDVINVNDQQHTACPTVTVIQNKTNTQMDFQN